MKIFTNKASTLLIAEFCSTNKIAYTISLATDFLSKDVFEKGSDYLVWTEGYHDRKTIQFLLDNALKIEGMEVRL